MIYFGKKVNARKQASLYREMWGHSRNSIRHCSRIVGRKNVSQRRALARFCKGLENDGPYCRIN